MPASTPPNLRPKVKGFDPTAYVNRKEARHMDRFSQFAVAASRQAVKHANLTIDDSNRKEIGVIIGSGVGGLATLQEQIVNLIQNGPRPDQSLPGADDDRRLGLRAGLHPSGG